MPEIITQRRIRINHPLLGWTVTTEIYTNTQAFRIKRSTSLCIDNLNKRDLDMAVRRAASDAASDKRLCRTPF
jgi:hypothetical protein